MAKAQAAYQVFAADLLALVAEWDADTIGVYCVLKAAEWSAKSLPKSEKKLAKIARIGACRFRKLWPVIADHFPVSDESGEGRRINPDNELQRERQAVFRAKQSENGKRGGRPATKAKPFPKISSPFPSLVTNYKGTSYPHAPTAARAVEGADPVDDQRDNGRGQPATRGADVKRARKAPDGAGVEGVITDQADIFGAAPVKRKRKAPDVDAAPNYIRRAAGMWQTHRGVPSFPIIGAAMKRVAAEIGEDAALAAFERFCQRSTANAGHFAGNYKKFTAAPQTYGYLEGEAKEKANALALAKMDRAGTA